MLYSSKIFTKNNKLIAVKLSSTIYDVIELNKF